MKTNRWLSSTGAPCWLYAACWRMRGPSAGFRRGEVIHNACATQVPSSASGTGVPRTKKAHSSDDVYNLCILKLHLDEWCVICSCYSNIFIWPDRDEWCVYLNMFICSSIDKDSTDGSKHDYKRHLVYSYVPRYSAAYLPSWAIAGGDALHKKWFFGKETVAFLAKTWFQELGWKAWLIDKWPLLVIKLYILYNKG